MIGGRSGARGGGVAVAAPRRVGPAGLGPAMAALPGPRKRSGPALCGDSGAAAAPPALRNALPPHKRPKSAVTGIVDPFGDCDDFTADDLEQIDILASQALSQDPPAGHAWGAPELPRAGRQGRCVPAAAPHCPRLRKGLVSL